MNDDEFTAADAVRCRARYFKRMVRNGHDSKVTISIPADLAESLAAYAKENNQSAEEAVAALVRTGLQSADQSGAGETGEDDPDNMGGGNTDRKKEHESIKETRTAAMTAAETFRQRAELQGKIAGFIERGDFASARECEKVFNAYLRHEAAANEPTEEQQRQSLVDSIVKFGTEEMRRRGR
jgi:hypothetical protein